MDLEDFTHDSLKSYIDSGEFIYIIYSEYGCKIGYTKSPTDRLEQIRIGLPSQHCFFIGLYSGKKAFTHEKKLHKIFKKQKISGEWFVLSDENLDYINNYLERNDFKCLIKQSIIWANYLTPSIFLRGKVKVMKIVKDKSVNSSLIIPEIFKKIFVKPDFEDVYKNKAEFLTPKEISDRLKLIGLKYDPITIGKYLNAMNFERKTKRIEKLGPRKGYYIMFNENVP